MINQMDNQLWSDERNNYARIMSPVPLPPISDKKKPTINTDNPYIFIPFYDDVIFPSLGYPIAIDDEILFLELKKGGAPLYVVVGTPKEATKEPYHRHDINDYGVLCEVSRIFDVSNDSTDSPAVILTTIERVKIDEIKYSNGVYNCTCEVETETVPRGKNKEFEALVQTFLDLSIELIEKSINEFPQGIVDNIRESASTKFVVNFGCAILSLKTEFKYQLLAQKGLKARVEMALKHTQEALSIQNLKNKIRSKTQEELDRQQKEYFLNQQIRMIQQELGNEEGSKSDIEEFEAKAKGKKWSDSVAEIFRKELKKLERLHAQSPDYSVQYQYLQTLIDLPWGEFTPDEFDLSKAEKILNRDHCGLEKVKERIIEHLAVLKLRKDMKSPILCLWGPPGVGKTSLGKSIAEALGRKYVRISLGGLHDEAEIRGHRRTYIGAMPGRIIQGIKKAGSANPVVVLDEIDKVSSDYKGDPSSALLEVLDPEQNSAFHDNYVDIDFDLSNVFFIATANSLNSISAPLLDRMELIEMSGYIEEEKIDIAKEHLVPKQLVEHGLQKNRFTFSDAVLRFIVEGYTRESGVRQLDKQIASVIRKVARKMATNNISSTKKTISKKEVEEYLGPERFNNEIQSKHRYYGVATGLAWTSVGGEILYIETSIHKGKEGQLTLTGNLGNVMKESASIALDYIRAHANELGLDENIFADKALHVHVPEGAIPKDGPSAGITMVISMLSALGKRHLIPHLAMTGEMTLRGKVLPVGGIKEKILAAKRAGVTDIILCEENKKDISQIKDLYIKGLNFHYVKDIMDVVDVALEPASTSNNKNSQTPENKISSEKGASDTEHAEEPNSK